VTKPSGSTSGSTNLNFSAPASALDYLGPTDVLTLTYTVSVNDGDGGIDTEQVTINITGTNDGPTIDLDASGTGTGYVTSFTEGAPAVSIADLDSAISDIDNSTLASATITLTNAKAWHCAIN
jgi:VCBS repeat-containing protein